MNWTLAVLISALVALAIVHATARRDPAFHPDLYCYDPKQIDELSGPITGYCEFKTRQAWRSSSASP